MCDLRRAQLVRIRSSREHAHEFSKVVYRSGPCTLLVPVVDIPDVRQDSGGQWQPEVLLDCCFFGHNVLGDTLTGTVHVSVQVSASGV